MSQSFLINDMFTTISKPYDLSKVSITAMMRPAFDTGVALTRLDERIACSPVGSHFLGRTHFADPCASLWIDCELVHLEELVLHDATRDIRTPTHELTIARDVLRTRRRIATQLPGWALSSDGLRTPRQTSEIAAVGADEARTTGAIRPAAAIDPEGEGDHGDDVEKLPGLDYTAIDALLARSDAAIDAARRRGRAGERDALIYDLDFGIKRPPQARRFRVGGTRIRGRPSAVGRRSACRNNRGVCDHRSPLQNLYRDVCAGAAFENDGRAFVAHDAKPSRPKP